MIWRFVKNSKRALRGLPIAVLVIFFSMSLFLMPVTSQTTDKAGRVRRSQVTIAPMIPDAKRVPELVFLEHADSLLRIQNQDFIILKGNVVFSKGDMLMYTDSAHFFDATGSFDAFGNVHMEQGDTLFIYGDELNYDGEYELAILYADEGDSVRLINRDVMLKAPSISYDMRIELGYYTDGGVLTDRDNRLSSRQGQYSPSTKDALFLQQVVLTSHNEEDSLLLVNEALYYNTATHITEFTVPTVITNKDGRIDSDDGVYNTETNIAELFAHSLVTTKRGSTLEGDTLYYDRTTGIGEAWGNMALVDTVKQSTLKGDYGFYNETTDSAFVTGTHAVALEYSEGDTLYVHGRYITSVMRVDSIPVFIGTDSVLISNSDVENVEKVSPNNLDQIIQMTDEDINGNFIPSLGGSYNDVSDSLLDVSDSLLIETTEISNDSLYFENAIESLNDSVAIEEIEIDVFESDSSPTEDSQLQNIASLSVPDITDQIEQRVQPVEAEQVEANEMITLHEENVDEGVVENVQELFENNRIDEPKFKKVDRYEHYSDTTHIISAWPRVRMYRSDMQGLCDSLVYTQKDSMVRMYYHPIVWSEDRQIFGNLIELHVNDSTVDRAYLPDFGFMAQHIEDRFYNQLTGKTMTAWFVNGELDRTLVEGSVEGIVYPEEADSTINKLVNFQTANLEGFFENQVMKRMKMWAQTSGEAIPLYLAKYTDLQLPQFQWYEDLRPLYPDDIFNVPPAMEELMSDRPINYILHAEESIKGLIADPEAEINENIDELMPSDGNDESEVSEIEEETQQTSDGEDSESDNSEGTSKKEES
ncbi:MAG: hypothetical protein J1F20_00330 [Muribaculaceae bacterium]|nr:hypothetical protein [Muribaculaceae bacterium]